MVMLGMLVSGTANTILMKVQNQTPVEQLPGIQNKTFNHPFFQCAVMFLGELLCLGVYGAKLLWQKRQRKLGQLPPEEVESLPDDVKLKTSINPLLLAIPAAFDCTASTLMNIALTMVAASVYQMLRGMIIIITAVMSIVFLKRKLYRHHWTSMGFIFLGVVLVGLAYALAPKNPDAPQEETKALGLILLVVA